MELNRRINVRYSEALKLQVVNDLESGKLSSIGEANRHYGITGSATVKNWLKKYGRNHLIPKVIRVERPNEQDQIKKLKSEIKQLKEALADSYLEKLVSESHFEVLCEQMNLDSANIKKKIDTTQSTKRPRQPLKMRKKKQR